MFGTQMSTTKKMVIGAMMLALCVVLPMAFHQVPQAGAILLPMHIPVLLAGLTLGPKYGLPIGLAAPILSSSITAMPPGFLVPVMTVELGLYGLVAGFLSQYVRTKVASLDLYIALIGAMIVGRVVAGLAMGLFFFGMMPPFFFDGATSYSFGLWASGYFVTALPGIVIQLAFVPSVVMALEREKVIPLRYPQTA